MLKTIILEGEIGEVVGREWHLDVASPNEAMRAIDCLTQGRLHQFLNSQVNTEIGYTVTLGDERGLSAESEYFGPCKEEVITFSPAIVGAGYASQSSSDAAKSQKKKGIINVIIGVVLIIVGIIARYPGLVAMGASMVLGGVASLLTPTPKYREAETERSTTVGGTVNTVRQGLPVPLGYGEMIIGSQMISVGVINVDSITPNTDPGASSSDLTAYQAWLDDGNVGSYAAWYKITH